MAQFDLNQLMQDPNFVSGIGLLGAASPRGKPLLQAFDMLQKMETQKREQAEQQQMMEYRRAQMQQAQEHAKVYAAQVEQQKRNLDLEERRSLASQRLMQSFAQKYGFDLSGDMNMGAPSMQPPPQQLAPPQPRPAQSQPIPPLGAPGRPLVPYNPAGAKEPTNLGEVNDPQAVTREINATLQALNVVKDASSVQQLNNHLADLRKQQAALNNRDLTGSPETQAQNRLSAPNAAKAISGLLAKDPAKQFEGIAGALQGEVDDARQRAADLRAERGEARADRAEGRAEIGLGLQQNADVRAGKADIRADKADIREDQKPPKGYIRVPTTGELVPELTEAEGKATAYYKQMADAQKSFAELKRKGWDSSSTLSQIGTALAGGLTNPLASELAQRAKQAQELWAEAYLRFKTGATTNPDEIQRNIRMFFPQIGDKPGNVKQKEEARREVEEAMKVPVGRGWDELLRLDAIQKQSVSAAPNAPRTIVRTGKRPDGTRVIKYSDGTVENVK